MQARPALDSFGVLCHHVRQSLIHSIRRETFSDACQAGAKRTLRATPGQRTALMPQVFLACRYDFQCNVGHIVYRPSRRQIPPRLVPVRPHSFHWLFRFVLYPQVRAKLIHMAGALSRQMPQINFSLSWRRSQPKQAGPNE